MKVLLDSCAFVDLAVNAQSLTEEAVLAFQDNNNDIFLSVATVWELGIKKSLGKLHFDITGAIDLLTQNGITALDISLPATLLVNELPYHHKDPFDRIIIATAKLNQMTVLTSDAIFNEYGISVINSRKSA